MKVGVTGTRKGITTQQTQKFLEIMNQMNPTEFHHGGCKGADLELAQITEEMFGAKIVLHLPLITESKYYLKRNREIIERCNILLAFPSLKHEVIRSGTWYTIRYAKRVHRKTKIIYPDGSVEDVN